MKITSICHRLIGDLTTPVSQYLKIREFFPQAILLESSDYASKENSYSFIAFDPLATIKVENGVLTINDLQKSTFDIVTEMNDFMCSFEISGDHEYMFHQSVYGYTGYNAVPYFESLPFDRSKNDETIPEIRYDYYRHVLVFDHFYENIYVIENTPEGEKSRILEVINMVQRQDHQTFDFRTNGEEYSNMTDDHYRSLVTKGKEYCQRGDVFQIVLARKYYQPFKGDDFNVYRALRSINPSPYLFYFDYGSYRIFGSSPEAQLIVSSGQAEIHPIAGTFKRTGEFAKDQIKAAELLADPKESAEHVMLVDLARNDLSRNTKKVSVKNFKEVQFFSHVIHLVSRVTGDLSPEQNSFQVYTDTFPAGTLSGAPKYRAMQLIDKLEPNSRTFYGGAIGILSFNGNINHAIIIRSFLSMRNMLIRQAGAGIVIHSVEESELQEVNNKLGALKKAILRAQEI